MPTLNRVLALSTIGLLHQLAYAQADSVGAGKHLLKQVGQIRPPTTIDPGNSETASTTLLANVHMKSQYGNMPRTHNYGQFLNTSSATLTITLNHVGGSSHRSVRGYVNDNTVAAGGQSATFIVPPGASYWMTVQDAFAITAQANQRGLTPADVGLPSAADFDRPTGGVYIGCGTFVDGGTDPYTGLTTVYYYQPYTRSDKSSRSDSGQPPEPPQSPGQCKEMRMPAQSGD